MEHSIYIKNAKYTLSKNSLISLLMISSALAITSFFLNFQQIITEINFYLFFFLCSLIAVFSLYHLSKEIENSYIYINDDVIWFKEKKSKETICLKFETLDYFETRFSEIIFCTKEEEKIVLKLNCVADEKKRWEIKEFLKSHVKQIKSNQNLDIASAT